MLWVSHLAPSNLAVVTVSFPGGQRVAQATTAIAGYNSFLFEADHVVGRMEGGILEGVEPQALLTPALVTPAALALGSARSHRHGD